MLDELISLNLFAFLLIFARMGSAITVMPGFSATYVNPQSRLLIALTISFVMTPILVDLLPAQPAEPAHLALLLIGEITAGLFLGLIPRIMIAALQTAGTVLSLVASMANAFIQDPIAEQQSSVLSTFLATLGMMLIFVTDTHHIMLVAVADSYTLFIPGQPLVLGDMTELIARRVMDSFALGVQLATPLIVSGLAYYLGLGLLGRLMPQLPVFFFGLPVQITLQLWLIMLTVSAMLMVFMRYFTDGMTGMIL